MRLVPTRFVHLFGRYMTKWQSDWPELFGMAKTKESAKRYQPTLAAAILLAEVVR